MNIKLKKLQDTNMDTTLNNNQILKQKTSNNICNCLSANCFKSGIPLQSYPENYPLCLRACLKNRNNCSK